MNHESTDLVIMDINLPYLNGFELVKKIRNNDKWKDTKIVILSTMHQEKDIIRGLNTGADEFICKPFQPNELIARVHKIMQTEISK